MFTNIAHLMAFLFGVIPTSVWVAIILLGCFFFALAGDSIWNFLRLCALLFVLYLLLLFLGWLLPDFIENILFIVVIILIFWARE